jgi:Zn-dependent M28 family amino/carboxypeptidase
VRFCWWGGEEAGLLGSTAYVKALNESGDLYRVALNLNVDMLASPNFRTGVYNGSDGNMQQQAAVDGSSYILRLLADSIMRHGRRYALSPFDGRSDYGPFLAAGVPAGGLDTGAEGVKSMRERKEYGGLARVGMLFTCFTGITVQILTQKALNCRRHTTRATTRNATTR